MSSFLYFAYGSNMLRRRLMARCPSAVLADVPIAKLSGHKLSFSKISVDGSGKGTIVPAPGEHVEGVLYKISQNEAVALDRAEGVGYEKIGNLIVFDQEGRERNCVTYVARIGATEPNLLPYDWYLALIRAGASENGLSPDYLDRLRAMPSMPDLDSARKSRLDALAILAMRS